MRVDHGNPTKPGTSTPSQRKYIVMLVHQRGMDVDDARDLAPEHCKRSLRNLSLIEASALIEALKAGRHPDYAQRPQWRKPAKPRPPRLQKGVARMPTFEQLELNRELTEWLARHYGKSVKQVEAWLAKRKYKTHGGPMHIIRTSDDCKERIELLKAVRGKAIKAQQNRQRSAAKDEAAA
ncbi:MAG: hypothetical protein ABII12_03310 [Planctomycetota bacterium]